LKNSKKNSLVLGGLKSNLKSGSDCQVIKSVGIC
jgi:hypothetical protein